MNIDIRQLEYINKDLRKLLDWLEESIGVEFTTTSQYRMNDPGVHGALPLRGTDLRMRNETIGRAIEKFINDNWTYDRYRPDMSCCMLHGEGSNMHLHIQVHPNTTFEAG